MSTFTIPELVPYRFPWYGRMVMELWVKIKQYVYERDKGMCQDKICLAIGEPVEYGKTHCHHGLPLSEGGTNHPTNLKTLCILHHKERHPHMYTTKERFDRTPDRSEV